MKLNQCFRFLWIVSVSCCMNCERRIATQLVLSICQINFSVFKKQISVHRRRSAGMSIEKRRVRSPPERSLCITSHIDTLSECDWTFLALNVRILHQNLLFLWFMLQMTWNYDVFSNKQTKGFQETWDSKCCCKKKIQQVTHRSQSRFQIVGRQNCICLEF